MAENGSAPLMAQMMELAHDAKERVAFLEAEKARIDAEIGTLRKFGALLDGLEGRSAKRRKAAERASISAARLRKVIEALPTTEEGLFTASVVAKRLGYKSPSNVYDVLDFLRQREAILKVGRTPPPYSSDIYRCDPKAIDALLASLA